MGCAANDVSPAEQAPWCWLLRLLLLLLDLLRPSPYRSSASPCCRTPHAIAWVTEITATAFPGQLVCACSQVHEKSQPSCPLRLLSLCALCCCVPTGFQRVHAARLPLPCPPTQAAVCKGHWRAPPHDGSSSSMCSARRMPCSMEGVRAAAAAVRPACWWA